MSSPVPSVSSPTTQCETNAAAASAPGLDAQWVPIQCDDKVFLIMRHTIHQYAPESLLASLFSQRPEDENPTTRMLIRNPAHPLRPFLFDRSPAYVEPIIQYLRTGQLVIPPSVPAHGVLLEAEYFGISAVVSKLSGMTEPYALVNGQGTEQAEREKKRYLTRKDVERIQMSTPSGNRMRLCGLNLSGLDFSGMDMSFADFSRSNLNDCLFNKTDLQQACFTGATMQHAQFYHCCMSNIQCTDADLTDSIVERCDLRHANLTRSTLVRCRLISCDVSSGNLEACDLTSAGLEGTQLKGVNLKRAILANIERQGTALTMGGVII